LAAVLFILLFDINLPSVESTFSQADNPHRQLLLASDISCY
jgi:hypothetical protein